MNSINNNIYHETISVSLEDIEYIKKLNKEMKNTNSTNTMKEPKSIRSIEDDDYNENQILEKEYGMNQIHEIVNRNQNDVNYKLSLSEKNVESNLDLNLNRFNNNDRNQKQINEYRSIPLTTNSKERFESENENENTYNHNHESPIMNDIERLSENSLPARINTKVGSSDNDSKSVMSSLLSPSNPNYDFFLGEASTVPLNTPFYQTNLCIEGDERADALVEMLKIKPYQDALSIIIRHVVSRRTWSSQLEYKQHLLAKEFHELVCEIPSWVDWDRIDHGQKVFWRYSWPLWISCIGSAMTRGATLPIPSPNDGKTPNQRLLETSQFLLECMYPDSLKPGNFGWSTAIRIRCAHSLSRLLYKKSLKKSSIHFNSLESNNDNSNGSGKGNGNNSGDDNKNIINSYQDMIPVSQADLIRTILYISLGSISAMKRGFGIRMEKTEKEDYVLLWRYISWLCGVDNQNNPFISVREGENATNQLIAAESCMFLDDEAVQFTSAMLQAMASTIPIFGRSNFVRAMTNEMARRLMGNEVVTNMKLKPKSNETHRQILKWIIQCCRFSCRVVAKNSFGKSVLCSMNRVLVSKMVWLANGGKWVDYSRGCYSGITDENTNLEENERGNGNSNSNSNNSLSTTTPTTTTTNKRLSFQSERDEYFPSPPASINSEITANTTTTTNRRRRSQIHSMDGTLVNEYTEGLYNYGVGGEEEEEEEDWEQKPKSTYTLLRQQRAKRRSSNGRPISWTYDSVKTFETIVNNNESNNSSSNNNSNSNSNNLSHKYSYSERNNPFSTKKNSISNHWIERMARVNMWAVVPAMSVAMAAYCVVLVYID